MSLVPRFTVIVPTFQRRELVATLVQALARQDYAGRFEVIVVVDGSTDGTEAALAELDVPFPLRILAHANAGLARARNRGAAAAAGQILLFLDDDMEPDPRLLAEHDRSHREGAGLVGGAVPLHSSTRHTLLADGAGIWAEERDQRLREPGRAPEYMEIVNGQFSIGRELFERIGGFDERFTTAGSYGNEDVDFGHRLLSAGCRAVYNPEAISFQRYIVDAGTYLRQYRQVGHADVMLARKHGDLAHQIFNGELAQSGLHRLLRWPTLRAPRGVGAVAAALRAPVVRRVDDGSRDALTARLFFALRAVEYWRGVHERGGIPRPRAVRVLSYHAIRDLEDDPVLSAYGIRPAQLRWQLEALLRAGYHFISGAEFLRFLQGGGLPRKPVLLTFDDCYQDLLDSALPVLEELRIPAVAFAVADLLGRTNEWDERIGASVLRLLDADGLRELTRKGIDIGAHSRTHPLLTSLTASQLSDEIGGSIAALHAAGLKPILMFAYPHGAYDRRVRDEVAAAGIGAAFTIEPGLVRPGSDPHVLPRIEILRGDRGWRFRAIVAVAGLRPLAWWGRLRGRLRIATRARQLVGRQRRDSRSATA